jgi:hypothetical protein
VTIKDVTCVQVNGLLDLHKIERMLYDGISKLKYNTKTVNRSRFQIGAHSDSLCSRSEIYTQVIGLRERLPASNFEENS